jgi:hypothetical protein
MPNLLTTIWDHTSRAFLHTSDNFARRQNLILFISVLVAADAVIPIIAVAPLPARLSVRPPLEGVAYAFRKAVLFRCGSW